MLKRVGMKPAAIDFQRLFVVADALQYQPDVHIPPGALPLFEARRRTVFRLGFRRLRAWKQKIFLTKFPLQRDAGAPVGIKLRTLL